MNFTFGHLGGDPFRERASLLQGSTTSVGSLAFTIDRGPGISVAVRVSVGPTSITWVRINSIRQERTGGKDCGSNQPLDAVFRTPGHSVFEDLGEPTLPFTTATSRHAEQTRVVPS